MPALRLVIKGDGRANLAAITVTVTITALLIKPLFIGARIKLPMLFLFFGILGGLAVFGAIGLILGPVVFALLAVLRDVYTEEYGSKELKDLSRDCVSVASRL